jgi:hypothetical protein
MDAAKADLLRALGRLMRGLSTLFWTIPLTLVADVETARSDWLDMLRPLNFAPALLLSSLLWYGLWQMRDFHRQERIWQLALYRAEIFAIINIGLAPFLYWWHRFPTVSFYFICVNFLAVSGFFFVMQVNRVLRRLGAMLPDEMLRAEARTFTQLSIGMLLGALVMLTAHLYLARFQRAPRLLGRHWFDLQIITEWLALFLTLMPVAVTLALLWKLKEAILTSFFEMER